MTYDTDIETLYTLVHEQGDWLTPSQLSAINNGMSALKTLKDAKLYSAKAYPTVSRETFLGSQLIKLAEFDCVNLSCAHCPHLDQSKKLGGCLSHQAIKIIDYLERTNFND